MQKKILIIAGGGKKHLALFEKGADIASFSDLNYGSTSELFVGAIPLREYGLIYIRLVGRHYEELAILVNEAKKLGIKIIDRVFTESGFARLPISKMLEVRLLTEAGIPVPKTIYGRLKFLAEAAPKAFGYPFVVKSTTGKQGHGVFSPRNESELTELVGKLGKEEKEGKRFLTQELIKAPKRIRALVVGGSVIGAIQRPTRWRKRFSKETVEKIAVDPVSEEVSNLAVSAAKALMLDIAGVDILVEEKTQKLYLLEVNSAPRWEAISRDCGINVEAKILEFLTALV